MGVNRNVGSEGGALGSRSSTSPQPARRRFGPGIYEASVITFREGEATEETKRLGEGLAGHQVGYRLEDLRERLGGDSGYWPGPDDKQYFVSIEGLKDADPHTTRCVIKFQFVPEDPDAHAKLVRSEVQRLKKKSDRVEG